jgi:hypothetical protein
MTILIEKVEVLMAIKRTNGELGDAAALVAAMAQREEQEQPAPANNLAREATRGPNDKLN